MTPTTETELRGRIAMMEILFGCTVAHLATLSDRPNWFIGSIMENTADMLTNALRDAKPKERAYLKVALAAYQRLSDATLGHLNKTMPPHGNA